MKIGWGVIGFIGLAGLVFVLTREPQRHIDTIPPRVSSQEEQDALDGLRLNFKPRGAGFGNVLEVDFEVKNTSVYAVKDVKVVCRVSGNSGTVLEEKSETLLEVFPSESVRRVGNVNMGLVNTQASKTACRIVGAVLVR